MHHLTERGDHYLTMGLVPLAQHARHEIRKNPVWLRGLMAWARAHGRRFYHFDGLEAFRQKMAPSRWETLYAISNEPRFSPASFYALAAAFCEGSVASMVLRGLGRAVETELKNLVRT
jgi:phosphatidylglycerol lysyltransferase